MALYKCTNFGNCNKANSQEIITDSGINPRCPECGQLLNPYTPPSSSVIKNTVIGVMTAAILSAAGTWGYNLLSPKYTLTVTAPDNGKITSNDQNINCDNVEKKCEYTYPKDTKITLIAEANEGFKFKDWGATCTEFKANECSLKINGNKKVSANFVLIPPDLVNLSITPPATGGGKVVFASDIDCGTTCSKSYPKGSVVKISANAEEGFQFVSWGGACSGIKNRNCTLTMNANKEVGVNFKKRQLKPPVIFPQSPPPPSEDEVVSPHSHRKTTSTSTTNAGKNNHSTSNKPKHKHHKDKPVRNKQNNQSVTRPTSVTEDPVDKADRESNAILQQSKPTP